MRTVFLLIPIIAVACSSADAPSAIANAPSSTADDGTASTLDTADPPGGDTPDHYALTGSLVVVDGLIDAASITVHTYSDEVLLCSGDLMLFSSEVQPPPKDEPILGWWSVSIDSDSSGCEVPADLVTQLGFGAYDSQLDVGLVAQNLGDATPYGLYLQAPNEPLWLVGVGGTEEQLMGASAPDPAAPVANGTYGLLSLVLTPWPSP